MLFLSGRESWATTIFAALALLFGMVTVWFVRNAFGIAFGLGTAVGCGVLAWKRFPGAHYIIDVLAVATRPVVVSHTGLRGTCETPRNLADAQMKRIADAGGIVAVGYWDAAVCDISPEGVVRSLRHAVDLLGVDHVALGSDFDGVTRTAFDTSELAVLTQHMLRSGFTREEIRKVMGENTARFLEAQLPPS